MAKEKQAQEKPQNKHFWSFRAAADDNAAPELILYGDIASETWWGDEVTPRQFTEELSALGTVPEIVVRINSGGGDVFAANAIYTRLKDNPAKITVKIDGWAASAATIVAMAGDVIEIPANGVFMVQDIEDVALAGFENIVADAKFKNPIAAGDVAKAIVAEQKKQGGKYIQDRDDDAEKSGAGAAGGGQGREGAGGDNGGDDVDAILNKLYPETK